MPKIKPVIAAGGVIFRIKPEFSEPEVLMILRNGFWDLPKGKLEKGESIPMCGAREVAEETGSEIPILLSDLGTTYHEYKEKGKKKTRGKTTYWYSMVYPRRQQLVPQAKEGITKVEWVALSEAIEKAGFDNLKLVLIRFQNEIKP